MNLQTYLSLGRIDRSFPTSLTTLRQDKNLNAFTPCTLFFFSIIIGHKDLNTESEEQKLKIKKWIIENYFKDKTREDEEVTLMCPQGVLLYTKPIA